MTNALKSYGFEKLNYCASEIKRCSPLFGLVTYVVWKLKIDDRIDNVRRPGPPPSSTTDDRTSTPGEVDLAPALARIFATAPALAPTDLCLDANQ